MKVNNEQRIEDLRTAAADFNAGLELASEAHEKLQRMIAGLPLDESLRDVYLEVIDHDTSIAICIFIMLQTARTFPAKFAAREIMIEMSKNFRTMLSVNVLANSSRFNCCPVHGPKCSEKANHAAPEDFPQHVDENLRAIVPETKA